MTDNPKLFYQENLNSLQKEALKLREKSRRISVFRFLVFIVTVALIYIFFDSYQEILIVLFIGIPLFVFFVFKYLDNQREQKIVDAKIDINKTEIDVLEHKFHNLEDGKEFTNPLHYYSNDVDLFGKGSFFQYINRTTTINGKQKLASILTENNFSNIKIKQKALQELSKKVYWRQHFSALASLVKVENSPTNILNWLTNYNIRFDTKFSKIPHLFSLISSVLIIFVSFGILSLSYITIWFFLGLFITGRYLKKTSKVYEETDKIRDTIKQYQPLLQQIEVEKFEADMLVEKQKIIESANEKASIIFKKFIKILDAFDQRNNIIIAVVGNALFLREIRNAYKTERWLCDYKSVIEKWFAVVAFFDGYNSLSNVCFNHPDFVFPQISEENYIIKSQNLGHPLLQSNKRIDNDFTIEKSNFHIVTGANMAGKSTFLRTVSLSIVMANCGLPVCADIFLYKPIKLITSMRTVDSLTKDESYFYAELKRLKFIIEQLKVENYFVILDEILKGTNSKDKAIGSKQFLEKLNKTESTGIIATHDVSLCDLENDLPSVQNYFFEAEIKNDELYFDYKLKKGICKNMNASFLLKQMKIVD